VPLGELLVQGPHPHPLDPSELFDAPPRRCRLAEAKLKHLTDDLETGLGVEGEARLVEEAIRTRASRLTAGIKPHSGLADPDEQTACAGCERHGGVRHSDTGFEQEAGDSSHREVRPDAILVNKDEGSVEHVKMAFFKKEESAAFPYGERPYGRELVHRSVEP
jgi:hypothetical protein